MISDLKKKTIWIFLKDSPKVLANLLLAEITIFRALLEGTVQFVGFGLARLDQSFRVELIVLPIVGIALFDLLQNHQRAHRLAAAPKHSPQLQRFSDILVGLLGVLEIGWLLAQEVHQYLFENESAIVGLQRIEQNSQAPEERWVYVNREYLLESHIQARVLINEVFQQSERSQVTTNKLLNGLLDEAATERLGDLLLVRALFGFRENR
jgi:hypothetical protein